MYYAHFGLTGPPFQAASPQTVIYFSPTHLEALATLQWGLERELNGFTMLTGEVGTGKTTLVYALLQRDFKQVRIAYCADANLSFAEILRTVLDQFGLYSTGTSKVDHLQTLDRFLMLRNKEERVAIILDEAQALSDETLEELRLLSNHGQLHDRCLQLVLVGQPELVERIKRPEFRQLDQRISARGVLNPLTPEQARKYVECRLGAQGSECAKVFEPGALEILLRHSDGIPRKINVICHNAFVLAYSRNLKKVDKKVATITAAEYSDAVSIMSDKKESYLSPAMMAVSGVALALMFLGSGYLYYRQALRSVRLMKEGRQASVSQVFPANGAPPMNSAADRPVAAQAPLPADPNQAGTNKLQPASPAIASVAAVTTVSRDSAAVQTSPNVENRASRDSTTSASSQERPHVLVRYGDTLEKIALRYLRSKQGINDLIDANPQLTNINQLTIGEMIYLPPGKTAAPDAQEDPPGSSPDENR
jgi:general secretion pathway protein A